MDYSCKVGQVNNVKDGSNFRGVHRQNRGAYSCWEIYRWMNLLPSSLFICLSPFYPSLPVQQAWLRRAAILIGTKQACQHVAHCCCRRGNRAPLSSSTWLILTVDMNRFILLGRAVGFSKSIHVPWAFHFLFNEMQHQRKALQNNTFPDWLSLRKHNITLWTVVFHTERTKWKWKYIYMRVFSPTAHSLGSTIAFAINFMLRRVRLHQASCQLFNQAHWAENIVLTASNFQGQFLASKTACLLY